MSSTKYLLYLLYLWFISHSMRKEGSAVLCEAVQGEILLSSILISLISLILFMIYSKNRWWRSWIWKRQLDEEKKTSRRTGTSEGGSLVLQEYGCWKRQSWIIRLCEVTLLLMSHMLLIVLIVLILQRFDLTCGIVQRSDGLWGTGSALVSRMISLKDTPLLTGRVYCTVMQEYWVIIRSLQSFQTRLLATCMNMMLIPMPHTASLCFQRTEAILMCMESARLRRL